MPPSEELAGRVPPPMTDDDWRQRIERKIDALVTAMLGTLENPGGALKRLDDLEKRVKALEGWRLWLLGIGTAVLTSACTMAVSLIFRGAPR